MDRPDDAGAWTWRRCALVVLLICIPLFFMGLGHYDLDAKAEPREGLTAWEMIHSRNWMLPSLNGEQLPEKPLMFPWMVAVSTMAIGEASEWATRIPAAASAAGLLLVVLALGRRLLGPRGGLVAAFVCASTFLVVSLGRRARVDMTLAFFVTLAIWLFVEDYFAAEERPDEPPSKKRLALFWLAMAFGTLTKGPLGAILPGLAIGPFLLARRNFAYVKRLFAWWGVVLYVVVAGSWYAGGLFVGGHDFGYRSFLMENFMMFFGEEGGGGHRHEVTYFVGHCFLQGMPWSLLLPAAVAWLFRCGGGPWSRHPLALPLLWFVAMFVFFSIAAGKRSDYLLPLMPAASILVAGMFDDAPRAFADRVVRPMAVVGAGLLASICGVALVLGAAVLVQPTERLPSRLAAEVAKPEVRNFIDVATNRPVLFACGALGALAAFLAPLVGVLRPRSRHVACAAACGASIAAATAAYTLMPADSSQTSLKPFATEVERVVPTGAAIRNYEDFQPAVMFYLRRRLPALHAGREFAAFLAEPGEGWILTDVQSWEALRTERKARLSLVLRGDHRGGSPTDTPVLVRRL